MSNIRFSVIGTAAGLTVGVLFVAGLTAGCDSEFIGSQPMDIRYVPAAPSGGQSDLDSLIKAVERDR